MGDLFNGSPEPEAANTRSGLVQGDHDALDKPNSFTSNPQNDTAAYWAELIRDQSSIVASYNNPEDAVVDEAIINAPRRRAADPKAAALAIETAQLLYPALANSLKAIIQYEKDVVNLRHLAVEQRKRNIVEATRKHEEFNWGKRIVKQGPWDPATDTWSLGGAPSLPMPVSVAEPKTLAPFFEHLALDGTESKTSTALATEKAREIEEPYYKVQSLEFEKGVLYSDHRMDLCKMVVGPPNIGDLMESLKTNKFVKHFLLGNNIIGPHGAKCIAKFLKEFPNRMDTWYLAGNCIDTASFRLLVDEWIGSTSVTNIWLKRNPLGPESADDIFRLIAYTPNLRTLDLDQTELGDAGVANLFKKLAQHESQEPLSLRHIYLNAIGIGTKGAEAIAEFVASPNCKLDAIYVSNNPLGNDGILALSKGLKKSQTISRLTLHSVGMSDDGAIALCEALSDHPSISALEIGQSMATQDLGSRYNWVTDAAASTIHNLVKSSSNLALLNLGRCALTHNGLNKVLDAVESSTNLLYYYAVTVHPQNRDAESVAAGQEHARRSKLAQSRLVVNVKHVYGVNYDNFMANQKRWLLSDETDVRKIDSVYRNRDAGEARRGLKKLDKWWDENDQTLQEVMKSEGKYNNEEMLEAGMGGALIG